VRPDTRLLAGRWIAEHARPGQKVSLPSALIYPNPVLADSLELERVLGRQFAPALQAHGLDVPGHRLETGYIVALMNRMRPGFLWGARFVVTAAHPGVLPSLTTTPGPVLDALREANVRP